MTPRALVRCALVAALLAGCGGDPEPAPRQPAPRPATRDDRAPPAGSERAPDPPPPAAEEPGPPRPPPPPPPERPKRPSETWTDPTQGPLATLVYVTEKGRRERTTPHVIIVGSDPTNVHFDRSTTSVLTVLRVRRDAMGALLARLGALGLEGLPWADRPADRPIGPERALLLYRDGRLRAVLKDELPGGAEGPRRTFTAVERAIITESMQNDGGITTDAGR